MLHRQANVKRRNSIPAEVGKTVRPAVVQETCATEHEKAAVPHALAGSKPKQAVDLQILSSTCEFRIERHVPVEVVMKPHTGSETRIDAVPVAQIKLHAQFIPGDSRILRPLAHSPVGIQYMRTRRNIVLPPRWKCTSCTTKQSALRG